MKSYTRFNDTLYFDSFYDIVKYVNSHFIKGKYLIFIDELFSFPELNNKKDVRFNECVRFLAQLRKRELYLICTAQVWSEIDIKLRKLCRYQVSCSCRKLPFSLKCLCINEINDGYNIKWNDKEQEHQAPRISTNVFKGLKDTIDSYDTFEVI